MEGMVFVFGTRALLTAHERMCMEDRERVRQMFSEVKDSIQAVERRVEEVQVSMSKLTARVAYMIGAAAAFVLLIEHFHLLSRL